MKVKGLREYLLSLDSKYDDIEIMSTNNIRGCETNENCNTVLIDLTAAVMLDEKGVALWENEISETTKLILY